MTTIHVTTSSRLSPERVLAGGDDFSARRAEIFPAVSIPYFEVHELSQTSAEVTEGTPAGIGIDWKRCHYDWSQPGSSKQLSPTPTSTSRRTAAGSFEPRTRSRTSQTSWSAAIIGGLGLAAGLHRAAVEAAGARGFTELRLFVAAGQARARRFYEREGWLPVSEPFDDPVRASG